jgi:hypothetical protein
MGPTATNRGISEVYYLPAKLASSGVAVACGDLSANFEEEQIK